MPSTFLKSPESWLPRPMLITVLVALWSHSFPVPTQLSACLQGTSAEEEDFNEQAGLLAEYRGENGKLLFRALEPRPLLEQDSRSTPAGSVDTPVSVVWEGSILIREAGVYRFYAALAGSIELQLANQPVLKAQSAELRFVEGNPVTLNPGEHVLQIRYSADKAKTGMSLQVVWSSDKFTLEPLPADALFNESEDRAAISRQHRGQILSDALRCGACHQHNSDRAVLAAPELSQVQRGNDNETLLRRLLNPADVVSGSAMPHFGFTTAEAASIAAFLKSVSLPTATDSKASSTNNKALTFQKDDVAKGTILLCSLGCVACHQLPQLELTAEDGGSFPATSNPYAGPSLVNAGGRARLN